MFLKCSLWSHGDFERGWTTQEHGPAEIISAGRLESGRRRSSRCFLMTRKCEYSAVMLTDETNRTFKDPSHHNSYKNSGGFSFLPSRLKDFHVFVWFSCCFSLQHTAVTGHQYPPWSWAADTAGAHSYRLAAVFTDRYRSSARMLTRFSLYLLSQFIVLGVDSPSNCVWCYCGWMTKQHHENMCVSACY